jgi:hypothetical protein
MPALASPALEAPQTAPSPTAERPRLFDGGPTLEQLILGAWEDLVADGRTACPVCGGGMSPLGGCTRCGSELS